MVPLLTQNTLSKGSFFFFFLLAMALISLSFADRAYVYIIHIYTQYTRSFSFAPSYFALAAAQHHFQAVCLTRFDVYPMASLISRPLANSTFSIFLLYIHQCEKRYMYINKNNIFNRMEIRAHFLLRLSASFFVYQPSTILISSTLDLRKNKKEKIM